MVFRRITILTYLDQNGHVMYNHERALLCASHAPVSFLIWKRKVISHSISITKYTLLSCLVLFCSANTGDVMRNFTFKTAGVGGIKKIKRKITPYSLSEIVSGEGGEEMRGWGFIEDTCISSLVAMVLEHLSQTQII